MNEDQQQMVRELEELERYVNGRDISDSEFAAMAVHYVGRVIAQKVKAGEITAEDARASVRVLFLNLLASAGLEFKESDSGPRTH